jgi:uncharacterized repeat protein (TIGR02543 family)
MTGVEISGNTAYYGGGVNVSSGGTFIKSGGGIIYGSDAEGTLKNTAGSGDNYGHAAYVYSSSGNKIRNTTAGTELALDSAKSGASGGWEAVVTFDALWGSPETQTRSVLIGDTVGSANMPDEPVRSGYAFGGWYTERNGGGNEFTASTAVTTNITVYAKWAVLYTVTFDADGGSPATQTQTAASGGTIGAAKMPAEPTRTHYTFGGWYTARYGGGSQFTGSTTVTTNITVYAKWTIISYTVTFNADGGSPETQTRTVTSGGAVGSYYMPENPTKPGYTFDGWYTLTGGNGDEFTDSTTITGNITVYAKWISYMVTFDADGGSPATQTRTVASGETVGASNMPDIPAKPDSTFFGGWYTLSGGNGDRFTASTTVTGNITVYAKWTEWTALSLNDALTWIDTNAVEGGAYTITVKNEETIAPKTLSYSGKTVRIILNGDTAERALSLSSTGSLFTLESGVTLILENNIILQGRNDNTVPLVRVNSGGTLVMNTGSKICGNTSLSSSYGGGVYVANGTFTMSGGEISGNTTFSGGGVYVVSGRFTMSGGTISGNTASRYGGGVYVVSGMFTMNDGEISGNTASRYGGGVYVDSGGVFTMSDGEISGNTAHCYNSSPSYGGGVASFGTFTKQSGGTIYGDTDTTHTAGSTENTARNGAGHAVYVDSGKKRNTTAGVGVTLDSAKDGAAGGWE